MGFIAIIGAGELGAATAARLAARDRSGDVRLIDAVGGGSVAAGKALDIQQSGPIEGFRARVSAHAELSACAGADVVVIADSAAAGTDWQGDEALGLIGRLWPLVERERTAVVCAGASQRGVIERCVAERRVDPRRLCGSAPGALESALRAIVAAEASCSPDDVRLEVTGRPPQRAVIGWSFGSIRGSSIADVVPAHRMNAIGARVQAMWPPGPYVLASAAARVVEALATGSLRRYTCFVALDTPGEGKRSVRVAAMPVRLGIGRIEAVLTPSLSPQERTLLETAISN
jgi:malate dehydrogenase